jgi:hypothetical protein
LLKSTSRRVGLFIELLQFGAMGLVFDDNVVDGVTVVRAFFYGDYSRCFQLKDMVAKPAALGKGFLATK